MSLLNNLRMENSGLVISAIFAAAMSSFSAGLNCLVTAFTVDWYERLLKPAQDDQRYPFLAKRLSYLLGIVITLFAIFFYRTGIESIVDKANEFFGYFGGALLGIFLLGVFTRRAKAAPTVLGGIISVVLLFLLNSNQSAEKGFLFIPICIAFSELY